MRKPEKFDILIVDDTPSKLMALAAILEDLGQNIVSAQSGREALRLVLKHDFAIILLDVKMPEMDGIETAELIRGYKRTLSTPIIFITSYEHAEIDMLRSYAVGVTDILLWPTAPNLLRAKVQTFINLQQAVLEKKHLLAHLEQLVEERTALLSREIEERKKVEENLRNSRDELGRTLENLRNTQDLLLHADKMTVLGTLASGVAHEILNPLNVIGLAAQVLIKKAVSDEVSELADNIIKQTARVTKITNNLRFFSHRSKSDVRPLNIGDTFDEAVSLVEHDLRLSVIDVERDFSQDLPPVTADPDQLCQVFLNLLTNARDAVKKRDKKVIAITARPAGDEVHVEFSDTGCGIPEAVINRIFEPFFTTKLAGEGTGLGLPITRTIIENCGGTIRVESKEEEGTRFFLSFPASK